MDDTRLRTLAHDPALLRSVIPVEQRLLYVAGEQAGDCWKCCIASILELDYDDVPHFAQDAEHGDSESWWNATQEWLRPRGLVLARFGLWGDERPFLMFGSDRLRWHWSVPGHWLAGVTSRRTRPNGEHIGHVVVMNGSEVAWDPHPLRDEGHLGFEEAFLLVAA